MPMQRRNFGPAKPAKLASKRAQASLRASDLCRTIKRLPAGKYMPFQAYVKDYIIPLTGRSFTFDEYKFNIHVSGTRSAYDKSGRPKDGYIVDTVLVCLSGGTKKVMLDITSDDWFDRLVAFVNSI